MGKKGRISRLAGEQESGSKNAGILSLAYPPWLTDDAAGLLEQTNDPQLQSDLFVALYDGVPAHTLREALWTPDPHRAVMALRTNANRQGQAPAALEAGGNRPDGGTIQAEERDRTHPQNPRKKDKNDLEELLDMVMAPGKYSNDQVEYLLTCIEDGADPQIIREIAAPGYPVNVMKKLKSIKERRRANSHAEEETDRRDGHG